VLRQILNEARQTDILDDINPEYKPPTLSVQMATTVVVAFRSSPSIRSSRSTSPRAS